MELDQETPAEVVEPTIVELDIITEGNADDSTVDESGKITESFDREKNIRYVLKGSQPAKETPSAEEAAKAEAEKVKAEQEATATGDPKGGKESEEEIEEFINPADYVLKKTGYKKDEVDLGDGNIVKIADLTEEQQLDLVITEFDSQSEAYEAKIKELEGRAPELKFEDPMAQQIVDYLKEGGDVTKLAKEILSKDPSAQSKMLSDAEIVKLGIKKEFSEFTDAEIEEEFKEMSPEKVARRAKALRTKMEKEKPDLSNLSEEQKGINARRELERQKTFNDEAGLVKKAALELKEIAGIPINDKIQNYLVSKTLPKDADSDSEFVTSLANNPKKLLTLEFWDTYGEKILAVTREQFYRKGLAEGNKGKEKLSDEPVRTYSVSSKDTVKKAVKGKIEEMSDKELEQFINGSGF